MTQTPLITEQWFLESMQIINWGGFNGAHTIEFAVPGQATIVSGSTGSGKSTLMDANTILMHPRKRLNSASNETTGRGGRSLITYVRGHRDKKITRDGEQHLMLRPGTTWSAIAQTWASSAGQQVTVFAAFYARSAEDKPSIKRFGHCEGHFDLRALEKYVAGSFAKSPLKPAAITTDHPAVEVVGGHDALRAWLFERTGVGEAGKRLTDTLYRIQTSGPIGSVHDLFQTLVLDSPDRLIEFVNTAREQWAETQRTYREVEEREDKAALLGAIPEQWARYQENRGSASFFDRVAISADPADTPYWYWIHTRQFDLFDAAEVRLSAEVKAAEQNTLAAKNTAKQAKARWMNAVEAFNKAGGGGITKVEKELAVAEQALNNIRRVRSDLSARLASHMTLPSSTQDVEEQRRISTHFRSRYDERHRALAGPVDDLRARTAIANEKVRALVSDRDYYEGRRDAIPREHATIRDHYAKVTGISADDLRFVGELLDMNPAWEQWRTAAELALGGFALRLLVPASQARRFRETTDAIKTPVRIYSSAVPDQPLPLTNSSEDTLAGRFDYAEHRYAGWLSSKVARQMDHRCVPDAAALNALGDGERGLTINGQVRRGTDGEHGGQQNRRRTIGFTAEGLIAALDDQIAEAKRAAEEVDAERRAAEDAVRALEQEAAAHGAFLGAAQEWERYDLAAAETTVETLRKQREALLSNDVLARLREEVNRLEEESEGSADKASRASYETEQIRERWETTIAGKDGAWDRVVRLEGLGVMATEDEMRLLDDEVEGQFERTAEQFEGRGLQAVYRHLNWRQGMARRDTTLAYNELKSTFNTYLNRYPTLALGTEPNDYYEDFAKIRQQNSLDGLPAAKEAFARNVDRFTGMTTATIKDYYQDAKSDIHERLDRINDLLAAQPFGPGGRHRLQIEVHRDRMPDQTREFLDALGRLGAHSTKDPGYDEQVRRYRAFETSMEQIATDADVERIFDVRKHVYLLAQEERTDGDVVTHDTFEEKSGGEYQELCAFVLAAAVRYQVGSDGQSLPRFAPVFLDEGLIKADPEVTRRAVNVWRNLGFQPIIAVPLDKHESVMVSAVSAWTVSKDSEGRSRLDQARRTGAVA